MCPRSTYSGASRKTTDSGVGVAVTLGVVTGIVAGAEAGATGEGRGAISLALPRLEEDGPGPNRARTATSRSTPPITPQAPPARSGCSERSSGTRLCRPQVSAARRTVASVSMPNRPSAGLQGVCATNASPTRLTAVARNFFQGGQLRKLVADPRALDRRLPPVRPAAGATRDLSYSDPGIGSGMRRRAGSDGVRMRTSPLRLQLQTRSCRNFPVRRLMVRRLLPRLPPGLPGTA